MTLARGPFDVKRAPLPAYATDPAFGRMSLDKVFEGDLIGTSAGEMLAVGSAVQGSAAYVALERVTGALHGRRGSFALHHIGVMTRGAGQLAVGVVPDSGTDELVGLTGAMKIEVVDGKHLYEFDYQLPG